MIKESVGENPNTNLSRKIELLESVRASDSRRSTGSVDRQRSDFRPLRGRSTGSVGRSLNQRASLSVGRPIRSTVEKQRATQVPRSAARSADVHTCTACTSVDWVGRPALARSVFQRLLNRKREFFDKNSLGRVLQNRVLGFVKIGV